MADKWKFICRGCQTQTDNKTGETYDVDKVRDGLNSKGTAETLKRIHRIKTGHNPEVMPDG